MSFLSHAIRDLPAGSVDRPGDALPTRGHVEGADLSASR
jgi:hypothetical protein